MFLSNQSPLQTPHCWCPSAVAEVTAPAETVIEFLDPEIYWGSLECKRILVRDDTLGLMCSVMWCPSSHVCHLHWAFMSPVIAFCGQLVYLCDHAFAWVRGKDSELYVQQLLKVKDKALGKLSGARANGKWNGWIRKNNGAPNGVLKRRADGAWYPGQTREKERNESESGLSSVLQRVTLLRLPDAPSQYRWRYFMLSDLAKHFVCVCIQNQLCEHVELIYWWEMVCSSQFWPPTLQDRGLGLYSQWWCEQALCARCWAGLSFVCLEAKCREDSAACKTNKGGLTPV